MCSYVVCVGGDLRLITTRENDLIIEGFVQYCFNGAWSEVCRSDQSQVGSSGAELLVNGDSMKLQWLVDSWDIVIKVNYIVFYHMIDQHHESIGRC